MQRRAHDTLAQSSAELPRRSAQTPAARRVGTNSCLAGARTPTPDGKNHTSFPPTIFPPPNHVYAHELERAAYCTATQPRRWPSACAFDRYLSIYLSIYRVRDAPLRYCLDTTPPEVQNDMRLATAACSNAPTFLVGLCTLRPRLHRREIPPRPPRTRPGLCTRELTL